LLSQAVRPIVAVMIPARASNFKFIRFSPGK